MANGLDDQPPWPKLITQSQLRAKRQIAFESDWPVVRASLGSPAPTLLRDGLRNLFCIVMLSGSQVDYEPYTC